MKREAKKYNTAPNLSSDTLFHLTGCFDILKSILQNGIQPRYIYEKLPGKKIAYFTQTICFCDIPLSVIKEHVNWYGTYGIGINRKIARDKGLSPIIYHHSKSPIFPKGNSIKSLKWFEEFEFTRCLKQVRGKQMFFGNNDKPYWKWKTFYNEKEWRYFPKKSNTEVVQYTLEIDLEERRQKRNEEELSYFKIEPEWIEYIVIKDLSELEKLKPILKLYIKSYEILMTKVITFKQIKNDF